MNPIHKYLSVKWYIEKIKRLVVHKKTLPQNIDLKYQQHEQKFSNYLLSLGITLDLFPTPQSNSIFENFISSEYSILEKLFEIKYNINDDIPQQFRRIYGKFSKNNLNNLIIQKSNIMVCPYCNENYIINRGDIHTSAQLDHFIDKSSNPLFSICLYNLIPCCSACNHIKHTKKLNISPFNENIDREQFKISFSPSSSDFITDKSSVTVDFSTYGDDGKKILNDIEQLNIIESYQFHNDYLNELIKKAYVYNESRIKELSDIFGSTVSSNDELYRLIFGNYTDYSNINSRPLTKLTQDILNELKIIKK